jgi:hypothetical protein
MVREWTPERHAIGPHAWQGFKRSKGVPLNSMTQESCKLRFKKPSTVPIVGRLEAGRLLGGVG